MNQTLRKRLPLLLSFMAGGLMWAAWPTSPLTFLVFIGFVPLLAIADKVKGRGVYFALIYLSLWIWNTGTTWWVGNTTVPASGIFANAFNALLMSIPWLGYKIAIERQSRTTAYFALIVYWLTFEYIHQEWELCWPWLTLGNAFAMRPEWVQWYEFTGSMGGSLWVLLVNIFVYQAWRKRAGLSGSFLFWREGWKILLLLIVPLALSFVVLVTGKPPAKGNMEVLVIQPNIDPYDEKFEAGSAQAQMERMLELTRERITQETRFVIWPETAIFSRGAWEHQLNDAPEIQAIRNFLFTYPNAKVITGASTFKQYPGPEAPPSTARTRSDGGAPYDAFNSAIQVDSSLNIQIYHKAKLVPGVEITPYMRYLPFMKALALDMGGITGSYGLTPGVNIFTNPAPHCNVFSAICYESVFSHFVAEKVREGANLLVVSTNDGWWGNTQGHKQHMQYARIRAIETRRWVARSANTGISCFVSPQGEVFEQQPYWQPGAASYHVTNETRLTFYVKYNRFIAGAPAIFCILLLLYTIVLRVIRR